MAGVAWVVVGVGTHTAHHAVRAKCARRNPPAAAASLHLVGQVRCAL